MLHLNFCLLILTPCSPYTHFRACTRKSSQLYSILSHSGQQHHPISLYMLYSSLKVSFNASDPVDDRSSPGMALDPLDRNPPLEAFSLPFLSTICVLPYWYQYSLCRSKAVVVSLPLFLPFCSLFVLFCLLWRLLYRSFAQKYA